MKFQVAVAVCMLVSTVTPKCENVKMVMHEKDDCSDEGKEAGAEMVKMVEAQLDKCLATGDTSRKIECDDAGLTIFEYKDAECKEEQKKDT